MKGSGAEARQPHLDLLKDRNYLLLDVDDVSCPGAKRADDDETRGSEGENEEEIKMRKRKMKSIKAERRGRTASNHRRSLAARCLPGLFVPDSLRMIGVTSSGG